MTPVRTQTDVLSRREKEVLAYVQQGLSSKEIAVILFVSKRTIDFHLDQVFRKLGVHKRLAAVQVAQERGYLLALAQNPA